MSVVEHAVKWAISIAEDPSYGYSQINRWGNPDYDCSSLVISAYDNAFNELSISPTPKTTGASYTGNMLNAFKACGFEDVTGTIDQYSGDGLVRGDVLLNVSHHTAMYVGDYGGLSNQMVQASIDEVGGTTGPRGGDQTGREIYVGNYKRYSKGGWDYILRYPNNTIGSQDNPSFILNTDSMTPFIAIMNEDITHIDYIKLSSAKVCGVLFSAGSLYDTVHLRKTSYINSNLAKQVAECDKANMQYGLYCTVRAQSRIEADAECKALYYVIAKYPPKLGIWLRIETNLSSGIMGEVLQLYYNKITDWGLSQRCGLYVTPQQLSKIPWNKFEDKFYLMVADHDIDVSKIDNKLLQPEMFEVED